MSNHDCWTLTGAHLRDLVLNLLKLALWGAAGAISFSGVSLAFWEECMPFLDSRSMEALQHQSQTSVRRKGVPGADPSWGVDSAACDASLGGQCAHPCRLRPTPRARDEKIARIRFGCVSFRRVEDFRILQSLRCSTGNPSGTSRMRGFMF